MREKAAIFNSYLGRKRILLLASWAISVVAFAVLSLNNAVSHFGGGVSLIPNHPNNEIGTVNYVFYDPENNYRPAYSFSFENLRMENNTLGIFKTALHQLIKIQGLKLRFYRYGSSKPTHLFVPNVFLASENAGPDAKGLIEKIFSPLTDFSSGWHINFDFGNVSEVRINDFNYEVLYEDNSYFSIHSKRAIASYKQSGLVLRGHVIIKTPDGNTLEANRITWDIKKGHFAADGVYVLNLRGIKTAGRNICLDTSLNAVNVQISQNQMEDGEKCLANL